MWSGSSGAGRRGSLEHLDDVVSRIEHFLYCECLKK